VPQGTDLRSCDYHLWSCPNAEKLAKQILILPNHYQVSLKDAEKVVKFLLSNS
jgi:dTDP-4-amino-4,6-dideoxygalactose transaminase